MAPKGILFCSTFTKNIKGGFQRKTYRINRLGYLSITCLLCSFCLGKIFLPQKISRICHATAEQSILFCARQKWRTAPSFQYDAFWGTDNLCFNLCLFAFYSLQSYGGSKKWIAFSSNLYWLQCIRFNQVIFGKNRSKYFFNWCDNQQLFVPKIELSQFYRPIVFCRQSFLYLHLSPHRMGIAYFWRMSVSVECYCTALQL